MAGQFRIPKEAFCEIWYNTVTGEVPWESFCLNVFQRFEKENLERQKIGGGAAYTHDNANFASSNKSLRDDAILEFLTDRLASKMKKINKQLVADGFDPFAYPVGFNQRHGAKKKKLTSKDINAIFKGRGKTAKKAKKK